MQQPKQQPTKTLDQAVAFLSDPRRETLLKARLVQLAFDTESQVAIKAIEMLLDFPAQIDDSLSDVSTETLEKANQLALDYILKLEAESKS